MTQQTQIRLTPGQSYSDPIYLSDVNGDAVDLTGSTATLVFTDPSWGTTLLSLSSAADTLTLGGTAGTITPTISGAQTSALGSPMRANVTTTVTFADTTTLVFYDTALLQ